MASASPGDGAQPVHIALFESGAFEFQDEAAQIAVRPVRGASPGMRVLDLAAGAGGKALALAAAMQNQGEIVACDMRGDALAELETARGAGRGHHHPHPAAGTCPAGRRRSTWCFVDAPCSGIGHLAAAAGTEMAADARRGWRSLTATQDRLLDQAGRPGGPAAG